MLINGRDKMSGAHFDTLSCVNHNIEEYNKKYNKNKQYAIGVERDKKNKNRVRFFDKNNETVWLPDRLYNTLNRYLIKNRLVNEQYISGYWQQIATGKYTDIDLAIRQKLKNINNQIVAGFKKLFHRGR